MHIRLNPLFLVKPLALATLIALAAPVQAATCTGNILLGTLDSGVADRDANGSCINDLIQDQPNLWGNHGQFVHHVSHLTLELMKHRKLNFRERARIMSAAAQSNVGKTLEVKIAAFNDFHGNLESPGKYSNIPVGGVDYLAAYVAQVLAKNPNHTVVSAGDLIGASPLISALFHDEPTIEAMNRLGLEFNAVGNHEFDEGREELLRMQNGGCHPSDANSCKGAEVGTPVPFEGANFKFLAANVVDTASGKTLFPAYAIKNFKGNKVAFIGMTLKGTPSIVTPSGVAGLAFKDEAATVNALVPHLKHHGVESIVVLVHEGGVPAGGYNLCPGISGAIVDIVAQLDDEVDAVISGHTHQAYNCALPNQAGRNILVTSAGNYGRLLSEIDLTLDTRSKDVVSAAANNFIVDRAGIAPVAELATLVGNYKTLAAPAANRVIGAIAADLTRDTVNPKTKIDAGESALGDVIADAQLHATQPAGFGAAVVSFMNPGGIRTELKYAQSGSEGDGNVTYSEAFTVQPFGNSLVTMTLTGAQIETLLEQQFMGCPNNQPYNRILQVSNGFSYAWNAAGPACDKVDPASIKLGGVTLDPAASYRVTVNNFMADGGDNLLVLKEGTNRLGGAQDIDALEDWLQAYGVITPGTYPTLKQRITKN